MARGAISEQARLAELYQTYGDKELLKLQAEGDALTDDASAALAAELSARRLNRPKSEYGERTRIEDAPSSSMPERQLAREGPGATEADDGRVTLLALSDGLELARVCKVLEEGEIAFVIATGEAGPERFAIRVAALDRQSAEQILRDKMQLFPLPEVQDEEKLDDHEIVPLGDFETGEEAEQVREMLSRVGIWSRLCPPGEGGMEGAWYEVEVRQGDLDRGLEVTAAGLGL